MLYLWSSTNDQTRVRYLVQDEHCREQNTLREVVVASGFSILLDGMDRPSKVECVEFLRDVVFAEDYRLQFCWSTSSTILMATSTWKLILHCKNILLIVQIFK